jgi:hypothetical protein
MPARRPWRVAPGGLVLAVRLTPKGERDAIDGLANLSDGSCVLKVRVRSAASEGEANAALIKVVAGALGVAAREVRLITGGRARLKQLQIGGQGPALAAKLERICAG